MMQSTNYFNDFKPTFINITNTNANSQTISTGVGAQSSPDMFVKSSSTGSVGSSSRHPILFPVGEDANGQPLYLPAFPWAKQTSNQTPEATNNMNNYYLPSTPPVKSQQPTGMEKMRSSPEQSFMRNPLTSIQNGQQINGSNNMGTMGASNMGAMSMMPWMTQPPQYGQKQLNFGQTLGSQLPTQTNTTPSPSSSSFSALSGNIGQPNQINQSTTNQQGTTTTQQMSTQAQQNYLPKLTGASSVTSQHSVQSMLSQTSNQTPGQNINLTQGRTTPTGASFDFNFGAQQRYVLPNFNGSFPTIDQSSNVGQFVKNRSSPACSPGMTHHNYSHQMQRRQSQNSNNGQQKTVHHQLSFTQSQNQKHQLQQQQLQQQQNNNHHR
eukprot:UN31575